MGVTLTFLSLVVLIPLSGLVWKTASLDGASLARAVLSRPKRCINGSAQ